MQPKNCLPLCLALTMTFCLCSARAQDKEGCKELPLISRFPGSVRRRAKLKWSAMRLRTGLILPSLLTTPMMAAPPTAASKL